MYPDCSPNFSWLKAYIKKFEEPDKVFSYDTKIMLTRLVTVSPRNGNARV